MQGTKHQVAEGQPKATAGPAAGQKRCPLPARPAQAWGVTCVQVLQQGPKGHRVDLQAESREGRSEAWSSTSPLLSLCSPAPERDAPVDV